MSTKNQISVAIPATVTASVQEKLQECRTLLAPYLQGLTPGQRETISPDVADLQSVTNIQSTDYKSALSKLHFLEHH